MAYFTETSASVSAQPRRAAAFLDTLSLKLRQRRAYRKTMNELCGLTQRDMGDLGMCRGDFRRLAREAAEMVK